MTTPPLPAQSPDDPGRRPPEGSEEDALAEDPPARRERAWWQLGRWRDAGRGRGAEATGPRQPQTDFPADNAVPDRIDPADPSGFVWLDEPHDAGSAEFPAARVTCTGCESSVAAGPYCEACGRELEVYSGELAAGYEHEYGYPAEGEEYVVPAVDDGTSADGYPLSADAYLPQHESGESAVVGADDQGYGGFVDASEVATVSLPRVPDLPATTPLPMVDATAIPEGLAPAAPRPHDVENGEPTMASSVAPSAPSGNEVPPGGTGSAAAASIPTGRDVDGLLVLGGAHPPTSGAPSETESPAPGAQDPCGECGGTYLDGYCGNCGAKAVDPRHHFEFDLAPWLAGICDRGVRHPGNEDALSMSIGASSDGVARAAMVVCDGVSTAPYSSHASMAAAQAATDLLSASQARGMAGVPSALIGAMGHRLEAATDAAADAVAATAQEYRDLMVQEAAAQGTPMMDPASLNGPSCTLVAAVVEGDLAVIGNIGDSRAYWLPDAGDPLVLTTDDSWATEQIRAGLSREEAESGPHAHTITRWLGEDCPDRMPSLTSLHIAEPGWLLLCSDGLWNYASEPIVLQAVFQERAWDLTQGHHTFGLPASVQERPLALPLAAALVEWAIEQGGHDNVTVALARLAPGMAPASPEDSAVVITGVPGEAAPHGTGSAA
ncbi:hypothetical protein KEM60_00199 [Austwickia sp. TVS 96-490-7B]|uniref:PP2C family protein-serine/threonine phosphatase n=1 Tax=Austwickia sp. TVS 96-490-7B TaxID=2830843 RepID=UPI001C570B79|nr:protein phosphatase 2C domain-containing protein [Austwickia sp. TVS 96-490-7B]MBW3084016.1 hypothetical protein [Austwickia sp. TVS 96-490-7B]